MSANQYTARHRSLLGAVAEGRVKLVGSGIAGLSVDGLWCDQITAGELVRDGLVRAHYRDSVSALVPAVLTSAGAAVLAAFGSSIKVA